MREAIDRSPWHRGRLAGVDIDRLDEVSLRELSPMTKADLMENFDRIVADDRLSLELVNDHLRTVTTGSYLLDGYTTITSGGSTGERGVFVYDWAGWATFWVSCFRHLLRAKWTDPQLASRPMVIGWVAAAHFTHATAALSRTFGGPDFVNVRFPVTLATEEMVAGLNEAQPDVVFAYPSALHVLSFEARAGRLRIAPRQILSCAEPLLPEIRSTAEDAWGVRVGNAWGMSEGGGVAIPCERARSHLSEDLVIVEPVDEDGLPVAPGERSAKVYLTNLFNRALPLIRYEITDEVTIMSEPCPCGSAHRCVADIQGRLDDVFVYARSPDPPACVPLRALPPRGRGRIPGPPDRKRRAHHGALRRPRRPRTARRRDRGRARRARRAAPRHRGHGRRAVGTRPGAGEAQALRTARRSARVVRGALAKHTRRS